MKRHFKSELCIQNNEDKKFKLVLTDKNLEFLYIYVKQKIITYKIAGLKINLSEK